MDNKRRNEGFDEIRAVDERKDKQEKNIRLEPSSERSPIP